MPPGAANKKGNDDNENDKMRRRLVIFIGSRNYAVVRLFVKVYKHEQVAREYERAKEDGRGFSWTGANVWEVRPVLVGKVGPD